MEHVYLSGSEDVRQAGSAMRGAAEDMNRAAVNIQGALEQHQRFLDDWLARFQEVLERAQGTTAPSQKK